MKFCVDMTRGLPSQDMDWVTELCASRGDRLAIAAGPKLPESTTDDLLAALPPHTASGVSAIVKDDAILTVDVPGVAGAVLEDDNVEAGSTRVECELRELCSVRFG